MRRTKLRTCILYRMALLESAIIWWIKASPKNSLKLGSKGRPTLTFVIIICVVTRNVSLFTWQCLTLVVSHLVSRSFTKKYVQNTQLYVSKFGNVRSWDTKKMWGKCSMSRDKLIFWKRINRVITNISNLLINRDMETLIPSILKLNQNFSASSKIAITIS